jgi:hypothetical protein
MQLPKLERRPELDALRGLFLVWMTVTHLPTRYSDFVNQPIGFISSAEGFVFISALLVGRLYMRDLQLNPANVRTRLWKRSLKIYGYHLLMLAFAFTVIAEIAIHTHKAALINLLDFYLAHPLVAIAGSVLLLYCPPLLDILPMYVTFLFVTPLALSAAARIGWRWVLAGSAAVWILAQFGLRDLVHNWIVYVTHLQIPLQETGAFNLFASRLGGHDGRCGLSLLYWSSFPVAGAASDVPGAGRETGQVADWPSTRIEPGRIYGAGLLGAKISIENSIDRTISNARQGFSARLLRAYCFCLCGVDHALRRLECRWPRSTPRHPGNIAAYGNLRFSYLAGFEGSTEQARGEAESGQGSQGAGNRKTAGSGKNRDLSQI